VGVFFKIDIVGASWLQESYQDVIDKASYDAPIVSAILGCEVDQVISANINGRATSVNIISIEQTPLGQS